MTELSTHRLQQHDLYDIAYLAGGLPRVVDAAVVALIRSGRVRAGEGGRLAVVSSVRRHPVEAAVLDVIGPRERRSVHSVRWRLESDQRLLAIGDRLAQEGLVRTGGRWSRRPVIRTVAGRRLLRRLTAEPPTDLVAPGTGALTVALQGADRLGDQELYRRIFGPGPVAPSRAAGRWWTGGDARGTHPCAYGGAGGWGGDGGCGGFDGGGGGGGDGGC
jgi:hypothetical protein